ncbi:hypothetical protein AT984_20560 [Paucibacter sp. KCTC 42545]|nr:hypothetical protein AT984_20560 [Paucibacter sp. KCTC 42545]
MREAWLQALRVVMKIRAHRTRPCLAPALLLALLQAAHAEPAAEPAAERSAERASEGNAEKLAPVTVSAARPQASKQVLTRDELSKLPGGGNDPMRAMQTLPGVVATSDGNAAPAIRGSRPGDNSYYIDFLPVGYVFHLGGFVSTVHADLVQQFDLYTGAFGPEYDDVHGGIVDVQLRKPRTDKFGGSISTSLTGADLLLEGPVNETQSFYFAAKRSYFDLFIRGKKTDEESGLIYAAPKYHDYQGRYLWKLNPDNELSFYVLGAADEINYSVPADTRLGQQQPALVGDSSAKYGSNTQALVWDSRISPQISNKLAVGHWSSSNRSKAGLAADVDIKTENLFVREQLRLRVAEDHELTLGTILFSQKYQLGLDLLDARCTEFDPNCDISSGQRVKLQEKLTVNYANLYAKDRWQISPELAATFGVHFTRDGYLKQNYAEPRLGLEWRALKNTTFTLALGKHNEFPDGAQVLSGIGNPKLEHVRAKAAVVGVNQRLPEGWSVKAEAYVKKLSGFGISDPALNYINGGSGDATGLELFVKKDAINNSKFSGWASVSLSRAQRKNDLTGQQFRFEYDQPVVVNLVGQYKYSDSWQFGAKWSYHSGNRTTPVVGSRTDAGGRILPVYGEINSERLPAYHRLDLRADWIVSPRLSYSFELINAYGHENVEGYQYSADYKTRKKEVGFGLMPNVGLNYKF